MNAGPLTTEDVDAYLGDLWCATLRLAAADADRSFFDDGGDSMMMVHMLVAVTARFDREFDYEAFVQRPTLAVLRTLVAAALARG